MRKRKNRYTIPSRVYIDQFKNRWSSKEVAKYFFENKENTGMNFSVVFSDEEIATLVEKVHGASLKANAVAENIIKSNKEKKEISADEKSYLYVVATKFTQALNDALIYEIIHDTNVISDSPALCYAIATTNQNIRKAAKSRAFKTISGKNYNKEFWNRPDDIIRSNVPGISRIEKFLMDKKLVNIKKMWQFFEKTELVRNVFYYMIHKDIIPTCIVKDQEAPILEFYKPEIKHINNSI